MMMTDTDKKRMTDTDKKKMTDTDKKKMKMKYYCEMYLHLNK
jgi:hypothetical protein